MPFSNLASGLAQLPIERRAKRNTFGLIALCLSAATLVACAKEHSVDDLLARAGERDNDRNQDEDRIDVEPPVMGPDAGPRPPSSGFDAGRPNPFDARVLFPNDGGPFLDARFVLPEAGLRPDAGPRDAGPRDAALDASDSGLPPWLSHDAATLDVNVVATCDSPAPPPDAGVGADAGCRDTGLHRPPCYRAPSDCPALRESTYCSGFNAAGDFVWLGLDRGTSCRAAQDARYPRGAGSNSFAQIGADIYSVDSDVILKRSLSDGSFDVAGVQAWTIFAMGDALVIHALDGTIRRFANWEALKSGASGEMLATATAGNSAAFGANRTTIAAAWPDGALYLLTVGDARQRSLRLVGYSRSESGAIRGLDISEDGRLFVSTDLGVSIFNSQDGRLISRMRAAPLHAMSCEAGLAADAAAPLVTPAPRPGYYAPEGTEYVISSSDCRGPFNGPRYVGPSGGAELFVIGNYFTEPSTVRDERSTPHSLVLTTVEPTQWNVTVAPNAKLDRIILNGATSTVVLQSPITIPVETFYDGRALGQHSGEWPSLDESRLRSAIETHSGRAVTEAFGCHFGSSYVLRDLPPACPNP
jgi:hypothetical protein